MNPVALSDLALTLACAWVCVLQYRHSAALTLAAALIGLAAALGVGFYSGAVALEAAHRVASQLSASAAFPLLAVGYAFPKHAVSRRYGLAAGVATVLGLAGRGAAALGLAQAGSVISVFSVGVMIWATARAPSLVRIVGMSFLTASIAVVAFGGSATRYFHSFTRVEMLHYLLAVALVALFGARNSRG